jgi:hypothetical protein
MLLHRQSRGRCRVTPARCRTAAESASGERVVPISRFELRSARRAKSAIGAAMARVRRERRHRIAPTDRVEAAPSQGEEMPAMRRGVAFQGPPPWRRGSRAQGCASRRRPRRARATTGWKKPRPVLCRGARAVQPAGKAFVGWRGVEEPLRRAPSPRLFLQDALQRRHPHRGFVRP